MFCLPVKISCPPTENVNKIPACQYWAIQVNNILHPQSDLHVLDFISDSYNTDNPLYKLVTKLAI